MQQLDLGAQTHRVAGDGHDLSGVLHRRQGVRGEGDLDAHLGAVLEERALECRRGLQEVLQADRPETRLAVTGLGGALLAGLNLGGGGGGRLRQAERLGGVATSVDDLRAARLDLVQPFGGAHVELLAVDQVAHAGVLALGELHLLVNLTVDVEREAVAGAEVVQQRGGHHQAGLAEADIAPFGVQVLVEGVEEVDRGLDVGLTKGAALWDVCPAGAWADVGDVGGGQVSDPGDDEVLGHQRRQPLGLGAVLQGDEAAERAVSALVEPVDDPPGLVALQVPPDAVAVLGDLAPKGHLAELAVGELGDRLVCAGVVDQDVIGDVGVPAGAQVDATGRRSHLAHLGQQRLPRVAGQDLEQRPVVALGLDQQLAGEQHICGALGDLGGERVVQPLAGLAVALRWATPPHSRQGANDAARELSGTHPRRSRAAAVESAEGVRAAIPGGPLGVGGPDRLRGRRPRGVGRVRHAASFSALRMGMCGRQVGDEDAIA